MTSTATQIMTDGGQTLPLQRDLRDALSTYARQTWRKDTAKHMAAAWDLPLSTAQNVLKGHASAALITHVLRVGGWGLATAIVGAVIGESLETFVASEKTRLRNERRSYEAQQQRQLQRVMALAGDLHLAGGLGDPRRRRADRARGQQVR
jgi:hypothetical protein